MRKSTEKQCVGRTANFAASIRLQSAEATPPCQCYPNGYYVTSNDWCHDTAWWSQMITQHVSVCMKLAVGGATAACGAFFHVPPLPVSPHVHGRHVERLEHDVRRTLSFGLELQKIWRAPGLVQESVMTDVSMSSQFVTISCSMGDFNVHRKGSTTQQ